MLGSGVICQFGREIWSQVGRPLGVKIVPYFPKNVHNLYVFLRFYQVYYNVITTGIIFIKISIRYHF